MLTFDEYSILGELTDSSWGRSSTRQMGNNHSSVKCSFLGKGYKEDDPVQLKLIYSCIMNFGQPQERNQEKRKASENANSYIKEYIKNIKSKFKEQAGRTLKLNIVSGLDGDGFIEHLTLGEFNGRRSGCYRKVLIIEAE